MMIEDQDIVAEIEGLELSDEALEASAAIVSAAQSFRPPVC